MLAVVGEWVESLARVLQHFVLFVRKMMDHYETNPDAGLKAGALGSPPAGLASEIGGTARDASSGFERPKMAIWKA